MKLTPYFLAFCATAAAACSSPDEGDEALGVRDLESVASNGLSFNGLSFNGLSFNGLSFKGLSFKGAKLNGLNFDGLSFKGSELFGFDAGGIERHGADLVGVELQGLFSDDSILPIRIDGARSVGDIWFYQLSYLTDAGRLSPCGIDELGAPIEAIALKGRWDTREGVLGGGAWIDDLDAFTFACRGASIGKCVELGYKPWSSVGGISLRDHHQACVRMLRADYCGDGKSWTVDGTLINLYDGLCIQKDTKKWTIEAEWSAAGARFISKENHTRIKLKNEAPHCLDGLVSKDTGHWSHFFTGSLLMSEYEK